MTGARASFSEIQLPSPPNLRRWALILLLTLLVHLVILGLLRHEWSVPPPPAPVEVQQIDPSRLEQIKKQWKSQRLLIDKNPTAPSEKEAPPNARYDSDRNIRVEKEQRARNAQPMPVPGGVLGNPNASKAKRAVPPAHAPSLSDLGIPFAMDPKPATAPFSEPDHGRPEERFGSLQQGMDQSLDDKALPEGNENLLNSRESIYYAFNKRLYETVVPIWESRVREAFHRIRLLPGEYRTLVEVVLDQEGNLVDVKMVQESGINAFDSAVVDSWKKIQRFPNPPRGLLESDGNVHIGWSATVEVNEGSGADLQDLERAY